MTDIEIAIKQLSGHSICLCKNGAVITDDGRGVSPMIGLIFSGIDLSGYSAADIIVGKAAAMLLVKAGIISVYGIVMSKNAMNYLHQHGIPFSYDQLTDCIINRNGTDICPMEKAVREISDPEEGYLAIINKLNELKNEAES